MSDMLVSLGQNPRARKLIKSLGLPIPLPEKLKRAAGPWEERPLHDRGVLVGAAAGATLGPAIAAALAGAGANPLLWGDVDAAAYREAGEAHGRPPRLVDAEQGEGLRFDALVFDASGVDSPAALRALYDFFHPWANKLPRSGRAVVLGRPAAAQKSPEAAAAQQGLSGFVRSLAKEIGRKGATAQLLVVAPGAEERVAGPLRFLLSARSAFITGQVIELTKTARMPAAVPFTHVLDGKVALVTGAARGIGAATAKLLAAEGAHVVCLDRPADDGPLSQVAREVSGQVLLCDISSPDAPAIVTEVLGKKGGVHVIVHNAGITRDKLLANMKAESWDQVLDVNLAALARLNAALVEGPLCDFGRIICMSSVAGTAGNVGQTGYAASKSGLIGLVQHLAPRLAARGITVNAIAPGLIETRLTAAIPLVIREAGRRLSSLSQGGVPQDVGEAVTFLASPGAAGLTGCVLRVCGGALIGA
ncbi:MAG: 3-oxoacyl-ACP reductase [Deltaproteobacteria bacterium]|nr:3-oxoacyl-ACP reductase [Deltaproteobacteria bacterium]